ncbi:hypothetical protein FRB97_002666 [Tulasnella sp. 331]|nr:hypothetical protein FRB97_002666 [Tulasnella sp. 331]
MIYNWTESPPISRIKDVFRKRFSKSSQSDDTASTDKPSSTKSLPTSDHPPMTTDSTNGHPSSPPGKQSIQSPASLNAASGQNTSDSHQSLQPQPATVNGRSSLESQRSNRSFKDKPSMPGGGPVSQKGILAGGTRENSVDVSIAFISAHVPKSDPGGLSDPYFKAELDGKIGYTSTAQKQTLTPQWNEVWHVKNVPRDGVLRVKVYDKDESYMKDDYIGDFAVTIGEGGQSEQDITGRMGKKHGPFKINIIVSPTNQRSTLPPYTFGGPCRYSRHKSPTVGALTALDTDERRYATWKLYIMGIPEFFQDTHQHWNEKYPAAQKIFGHGPVSSTIRLAIHSGHKMLYARTTANAFGVLNRAGDLLQLFKDETTKDRIKPAVYTYIINDDTWRFSETGAAFFVDFVSKHALHSDVAEEVRYSGEFHWRPVVDGYWGGFHETNPNDDGSVQWELVIDNNSGTYCPDKNMLPKLKSLIEYNFPGLKVAALDHGDPDLKKSIAALKQYAEEHRGINSHDFDAHDHFGSTTLNNIASKMHLPIGHNRDVDQERELDDAKEREKAAHEKEEKGALNA